jgi:outer membrane receptor for ferrienterochelin and colicins
MNCVKYRLLLLMIISGSFINAQIKGKVVELIDGKDSTAVPGITVFWENTAIAVSTDLDGRFEIKSGSTNRLRISAIGYENKVLTVKDTTKFLTVVLKSGAQLKEVEVIYHSTGTEISYLNPIKTELLNERSLMKAACCNLSESFETNPSIDVNFTDAVSGAKQIQMLGLSGQYAQITKENMPYMRGLANNYGLTFIPGTWIQSIQLSKGAGSVVNGYESFTGQINTELQSPANSDRLHFNAYANENGRNEYNLNLSNKLNKNLSAGLLSHVSFNPLHQDLNKDGFADIPTGKQYNFMNKYELSTQKGFEAQFGGAYLKDERKGGQANFRPGFDSLRPYQIGINNEKWEVYSKTGFIFKKKPGTSLGLQLSYLDHKQDNLYGNTRYSGNQKTLYANLIYQGFLGNTNHTYKLGSSFINDLVDEQFSTIRFKRDEIATGIFSEYAYSFGQKFNAVAGLRADHHNYYGLFFTPRLHLRYAFTPSRILRFSGGSALRTANIFADNAYLMASSRTWVLEGMDPALPYNLKPERGWNYGLNYTHKFQINYRDAYITVDAYRTEFSQQVVVDLDEDSHKVLFYNLNGPSFSNSLQFEFNMEPRKRFFVKSAYRYVDNKMSFKSGLLEKAMVSKHRAFINLAYETKDDHWQFDFTTQYNGQKRLPQTLTNEAKYRLAAYSPAYFNLMGQITYLKKIYGHDLHLYLGVENLLNFKQNDPILAADLPFSQNFDASMVWGPIYGRMLYAGLRFKIK